MRGIRRLTLVALAMTGAATTGCAERLMKEGLGAALGADGRFVPLHRAASATPATPKLEAPAAAQPPAQPHAQLASAASTTPSPTPAPAASVSQARDFAPVLLNYKGLKLDTIDASADLPEAAGLSQKLKNAWTRTLSDVQLKPEGTPLATLSGEVIHYEGLSLLDAASAPFAQIIVRAKLTDAASGKTLATANLIGRSTAVASGTIDGLSGGVAKALAQWLAREGAVVTGMSGLRNAQSFITNPTAAIGSPSLPKSPTSPSSTPAAGTAPNATTGPSAGGTTNSSNTVPAMAAPGTTPTPSTPTASTGGATAPMTPAGSATAGQQRQPAVMTPATH